PNLADAEGTAAAWQAEAAQEEADQLPESVEAQAAGHHRIALEVAGEEPEVGLDVELRDDLALLEGAALFADMRDAIEHQHRRQRKLCVAWAEQLALATGDQVVKAVAVLFLAHTVTLAASRHWRRPDWPQTQRQPLDAAPPFQRNYNTDRGLPSKPCDCTSPARSVPEAGARRR